MKKQKLNRALVQHSKPREDASKVVARKPWRPKEGWCAYNLHRRIDQSVILTGFVALVDSISDEEAWAHWRVGCKGHDIRLVLKMEAVRFLFRASEERTIGLTEILRGALNIPPDVKLPSRSTLGYRLRKPELTNLLEELLTRTVTDLEGAEASEHTTTPREDTVALDSTGFAKSRHEKKTWNHHGKRHPRGWMKAHLCTGTKTLRVYAITITEGTQADTREAPTLLSQARTRAPHLKKALGDGAYAARPVCTQCETLGFEPTMKIRKDATQKSLGHPAYPRMVRRQRQDPEAYARQYHQRSTIESANHAIKHRLGDALWTRHPVAQQNELRLKVVLHNLGRPRRAF